jgi:nitrile hydratase subunit alpha
MAADHPHATPPPQSPAAAHAAELEARMVAEGLVTTDAVDAIVEAFGGDVGPRNGARMVARSWVDDDYRALLLTDATAAGAQLGFGGPEGEHVVAVANEPGVHNVVVCTLCSCYPWPLLGIPPVWYKSAPYRSRVVREPRTVLAEMGLVLDPDVEIRVWDASAEVRYLVVPERPAGTDGWTEDQLAELVSRDAMIGVAQPTPPR